MSLENSVAQNLRNAATRIIELLHASPDDAAACVDEFVSTCNALPPGQTAIDLASVLEHHSKASFRRLEIAALHRFHRQLRLLRPLSGSSTKMPRALAELRSAARAWSVSPLVLLAEFSHAPTSDNFWRLLSKLARSSLPGSWPEARKRLHAARHRRCHDPFSRRKGVSHVQPWAISDIVSISQQQEPEPARQNPEDAGTAAKRIAQPAQTLIPDNASDAALRSPRGERQCMSSYVSSAHPEASGADDDYEEDEDRNDWANNIQISGSEHTSIWHISYGWWLPSDIVGRLCISLAQIQPNVAVIGVGFPRAAPVCQSDATLVVPLQMKTQHWTLAIVCLPEKIISMYDPLSSTNCRPSQADTDITAALEDILSTQRLAGEISLVVSDCAIVARSCPMQSKNIDSGVAAIALSLYCLVGRAMPQNMDPWLWRRMLSNYMAQFPSDDAAQTAKNAAVAAAFSANHTALYEHTNRTSPFSGSRMALRNNAMEGRAIWMAAARLADNAKEIAHSRRYDIQCELRRSRHTVESEKCSRLETAVKAAEACTAIAAVTNGIRAVLDDLNMLLEVLVTRRI